MISGVCWLLPFWVGVPGVNLQRRAHRVIGCAHCGAPPARNHASPAPACGHSALRCHRPAGPTGRAGLARAATAAPAGGPLRRRRRRPAHPTGRAGLARTATAALASGRWPPPAASAQVGASHGQGGLCARAHYGSRLILLKTYRGARFPGKVRFAVAVEDRPMDDVFEMRGGVLSTGSRGQDGHRLLYIG
eukprot:scaffold1200_cov236-Isochrysis_galbana.AAC.8